MAATKQLLIELPIEIADQLEQKAAEAKLPLQVIVGGQLIRWVLGNHPNWSKTIFNDGCRDLPLCSPDATRKAVTCERVYEARPAETTWLNGTYRPGDLRG